MLDLRGCTQLDDATFRTIVAGSSALTSLDVSGCRLLTDEGLQGMAQEKTYWGWKRHSSMKRLRRLRMAGCCQCTDNGLQWVTLGCPELVEVDMSHWPRGGGAMGMRDLGALKHLSVLHAAHSALTDKSILAFTHTKPLSFAEAQRAKVCVWWGWPWHTQACGLSNCCHVTNTNTEHSAATLACVGHTRQPGTLRARDACHCTHAYKAVFLVR